MEEIVNKVAQSGIVTIDLEKFYDETPRVLFDIKPLLFQELMLKEKDFRAFVKAEDWTKYQNKFDGIQELLGLTEKEKALVLSINRANDPKLRYKEVFISLGGQLSKVYRTEVSTEEYLAYTTEEREKMHVQAYAKKYGSLRRGIAMLAQEMKNAA